MAEIIEKEKARQWKGLELIPSENFVSKSVMDAVGSVMTNKYSEGYPGARYYGGNEFIDMAETLCQQRALKAFNLDPAKWGVNVQSLSGSPSNFQVYTALLQPHDKIMALDLPHGGHLSHGYQTDTKKISATSIFFTSVPYRLDESTGLIDYDACETTAAVVRPKLIVAGASAYARLYDYNRMRSIADKSNAYLLADMAHISGLVAAGVVDSPFNYADVVTFTTHKVLRGPRGGMILSKAEHAAAVDKAVFPMMQGGPLMHSVAAKAVALKEASTPEYQAYAAQVIRNAQALTATLADEGMRPVSGGTDTHLALIDLRGVGVTGADAEVRCDDARITLNKNAIPYDPQPPAVASGIRVGTPSVTTQGMGEPEMAEVGQLIARAVKDPSSSREVADQVSALVRRFPAYAETPVGV